MLRRQNHPIHVFFFVWQRLLIGSFKFWEMKQRHFQLCRIHIFHTFYKNWKGFCIIYIFFAPDESFCFWIAGIGVLNVWTNKLIFTFIFRLVNDKCLKSRILLNPLTTDQLTTDHLLTYPQTHRPIDQPTQY